MTDSNVISIGEAADRLIAQGLWRMFHYRRMDTGQIAQHMGLNEFTVYNAIARYREYAREISQ